MLLTIDETEAKVRPLVNAAVAAVDKARAGVLSTRGTRAKATHAVYEMRKTDSPEKWRADVKAADLRARYALRKAAEAAGRAKKWSDRAQKYLAQVAVARQDAQDVLRFATVADYSAYTAKKLARRAARARRYRREKMLARVAARAKESQA